MRLAAQPPDAPEVEAIFSPSEEKREKALRDAIDLYLNPASGIKDPQAGLNLSLNLAVFYFEHDRLDDAEKFFTRLEGTKERRYATLGHFGRAIVLALRYLIGLVPGPVLTLAAHAGQFVR